MLTPCEPVITTHDGRSLRRVKKGQVVSSFWAEVDGQIVDLREVLKHPYGCNDSAACWSLAIFGAV